MRVEARGTEKGCGTLPDILILYYSELLIYV